MKDKIENLYEHLNTYEDFPVKGVSFKDIMPLLADKDLFTDLVNALSTTIPGTVTCIVAPESRGFILGSVLAFLLHIKFVPLRKPGKLPGEILSTTYKTEYSNDTLEIKKDSVKGEVCWFIDDILATGGTYRAASILVEECGGKLLGGTVLLKVLNDSFIDIKEIFKDVKNK